MEVIGSLPVRTQIFSLSLARDKMSILIFYDIFFLETQSLLILYTLCEDYCPEQKICLETRNSRFVCSLTLSRPGGSARADFERL